MRVAPWHSSREEFHHNNSDCEDGGELLLQSLEGAGGKRIRSVCRTLDARDEPGREAPPPPLFPRA